MLYDLSPGTFNTPLLSRSLCWFSNQWPVLSLLLCVKPWFCPNILNFFPHLTQEKTQINLAMAYLCSLSVMDLGVTQSRQWYMSTGLLRGFLGNVDWFWRVQIPEFVPLLPLNAVVSRNSARHSSGHFAALGEPHWSNASALGKTKQEDERSLGLWWHCSHHLNQAQRRSPSRTSFMRDDFFSLRL